LIGIWCDGIYRRFDLYLGDGNIATWNLNLKFGIWHNEIYCVFEFVFECGECRDDSQKLAEFGIWNLEFGIWNLEFGTWI
jgi:hypothetical protein